MKNHRAKLIILILIFSSFVFTAKAQEKENACSLDSQSAPLLFNLRLGMSAEQVQNLFGKVLKIKIKKKGARTFFQNFIKKPAPSSLNGVRALYLRFFDQRLYQIEIFYESRADLENLAALIGNLSSQLNLSTADWQIKYDRAEIKCGEIALVADYVLNPRIELTDEIIRAEIERQRQK